MSCIQLARGWWDGLLSSKAATMDMSIRCSSKQAVARLHTGSPIARDPTPRESYRQRAVCGWARSKGLRREQGEIAAVILEPMSNAGLFRARLSRGTPGCLRTAEGSLLIFDEVMTGFRVAPGGAQELYRIMPDLTALGK